MSIEQKIIEDLKVAMKAKDKISLEALRAVKSAFMLAKTNKGAGAMLDEEEELKIIQKLVKQRNDSAAIYKEQGRGDLYQKETAEVSVLEKFLPKKISVEELTAYLKELVNRLGVSGPQEIGKVMGVATKELAGKADGKEIAAKVKEILGSS